MKSLFTAILFAGIILSANCQINILRYNDNFSYLKNDSVTKKGMDKLKYISFLKTKSVSFGGEVREQLQYYRNINFSDVPPTFNRSTAWQLWQRVMLHSNIEWNKTIRLFIQLGSTHRFINPNPLTPEIEQNDLSLHQAFMDYKYNANWMLRLGRQELSYGSHRLITFREGPNTRLTFDGTIIKYVLAKRKVDIFELSPVISKKGIFDDEVFKDRIAGIYATETIKPKALGFDYYFLNFKSDRRQYNFVSGKENRQVVGMRLFSQQPIANYELEVTYQFGKFNDLRIKAYSISVDVNYKFLSKKNAVIGMAGNYVSGDRDREDKQLNAYNLLFSKPQYGLTAPIGATNIITISPYLKINPMKCSNVYIGTNFLWRQSSQDGTYSPSAIEMRPTPQLLFKSSKKRIGTLVNLETNYSLNAHLSFAVDASYFQAGELCKGNRERQRDNLSFIQSKL